MKAPTLFFASSLALAAACGDDNGPAQPDAGNGGGEPDADNGTGPDAGNGGGDCEVADWDAPDFEENADEFLAIRDQLATLKARMGTALNGQEDFEYLESAYTDGDTSLADITTPAYDEIVRKTFNDLLGLTEHDVALLDGDGNWSGGGGDREGTLAPDDLGFDGGGNEPVQLMEKGLFGAAQYNYALTMTEGDITPATVDALAAAWGTNATLDPEEPDDTANYAHGMGLHADTAEALTAAKSYAADDACAAERDEAVESFFHHWELALMARAIYYINGGREDIQAAVADEDEAALAGGLHALSEGVGLALGLYQVEDPAEGPLADAGRRISDEDIEAIMEALGIDNETEGTLNQSTTGDIFVNDNTTGDEAQADVEAVIMEALDLDESDIEGFYDPTAG